MRFRSSVLFVFFCFIPAASFAQTPLVSKWEKVGPVNFTALVHQSPSTIVATTSHGYLYTTHDDGTTWQRREIGDTLDLTAISFGDSLHGTILFNGGALSTTDGGGTWERNKNMPNDAPFYLTYIGADTICMVNWIGNLYRTTDGGSKWDTVFKVPGSDTATMTDKIPMKIAFFNKQRGYVLGVGMYLETSDGGAHWTSREIAGQDGAFTTLYDIDFYNRDTGVMSGSDDYFTTTDAGATWLDHPMPHDERNDYLPVVRMFGPQNFFMFGTPNAYYYTSNDFGATFTLTPMPQANSIESVVQTASGGWLAVGGGWLPAAFQYGAGGTILRGVLPPENAMTPEWTVLAECPMGPGPFVHATNGGMLQCVSSSVTSGWNAYPLFSSDSGIFWHVSDQQYPEYSGMHFSSPDTGYLYHGGWLSYSSLKSTDCGRSWKKIAMTPSSIYNPSFASSDTGYGFSGSVVRTTDAGISWQPDSIAFSTTTPYSDYLVYRTSLVNISALDGFHAFVTTGVNDTLIANDTTDFWVGSKIHWDVYETTDAGISWTKLPNLPIVHSISQIYFLNTMIGYLLPDSGRIYRTSDGGNSWTVEQLAPVQYSFTDINFLNDRIGFLTVDSQAVLETTNGGLNWTWLLIPTNREEVSMTTGNISFPDSNTVLLWGTRTLNVTPYIGDYGLYRAKLNIPPLSAVHESPQALQNDLAISVYPNPAEVVARIRISSPSADAATLEIFDLAGRPRLVARAETNTDFTLELASFPAGVYALRGTSGSESATTTFTIIR